MTHPDTSPTQEVRDLTETLLLFLWRVLPYVAAVCAVLALWTVYQGVM